MKHAGDAALDRIDDLLTAIRRIESLSERKRGVFYYRSRAMLHFHEDHAGLFADLRVNDVWERFPVNSARERRELLARIAVVA